MMQTPTLHPHQSLRLPLFAAAVFLFASIAHAQLTHEGPAKAIELAARLPPFDVISIKPNNSGEGNFGMGIHGDTFTANNVPISMLIAFAYDINDDFISGLSGPVNSAHFDIEAKIVTPEGESRKVTDKQMQAMLIPLLADRFHLKAHLASKTLPVYDLIVNRGGPKIKLSREERKDSSWNFNWSNNDKVLTAKDASMLDLAEALSDEVHRHVADKTGLTGSADITLKWTSDSAAEQGAPVLSIFTAVEEQLGLKLQPSKGPVDTLVIDHVEMPSQN